MTCLAAVGLHVCVCIMCCCFLYVGKRERIEFSQTVTKYDRRFKVSRSLRNAIAGLGIYAMCSYVGCKMLCSRVGY